MKQVPKYRPRPTDEAEIARLAGIDEAGATEGLSFIPTDPAVMEQLVVIVNGSKPK